MEHFNQTLLQSNQDIPGYVQKMSFGMSNNLRINRSILVIFLIYNKYFWCQLKPKNDSIRD